eukprot:g14846.t1
MSYALQTLEDEVATSALARNSKGDHDPEQRARKEKYVRAFAKRVKVATVRECTAGQRITAKLLGERYPSLQTHGRPTAEQKWSVATATPDGNANGDSCSSSDEEEEGEGLRIDPKEDEMFVPNLLHPVDVRGAFLEKVWSRQALLIRNNPRTVTKTSVSVPSFPGEFAAGELQQSMVDRARATAHGIIKEAPAMWARYAFLTALDKLEAKRGAKKAPAPQNKEEEDGGPHDQHIDDAKLAFPDCCVALPADHVSCLGGALRGLGPSARDERQAEEAVTLARYVPLDVKRFRAAEKRLGDLPQDLEEFLMRMYDEADLEERSSTSDKENGEAGEQGGEDDDNEVDSGRENTSAKMEGAVATHEEESSGHQDNSDSSQDNSEEQSQSNSEKFLPAEVPFDQTDEGIRRRAEIGKFMERFETLVSDYLFDLDVTALVNAVPENGRGEQEVFVWMDPNHHNPNPNHKQHASSGAAAKPHSSHSGALRAFFRAREKECVDVMESTAVALRKGDAPRLPLFSRKFNDPSEAVDIFNRLPSASALNCFGDKKSDIRWRRWRVQQFFKCSWRKQCCITSVFVGRWAAEDDTASCDGAAGWCKNLQKKSKQTRSEIETFVSKKGHITDWHTDFQENFTVQLQGVKRWYIKRGELTEPILGMTPHYDVDVNDPTQENEMRYYLKHQTRRAPKVEWINGEPRCTVIKPDGATTATGAAAGRSQHSQDQNGELHFPNSSCNNGADIDELLTPGQTEYRPEDGYFAADCDVIEVYPGDVLYFPSGMWHRVETVSEEHSISINFSLSGKRWSDLIGDSLKQVMNNHPSLRQKVVGCFSQEDFRNKAGFYLNLAGRWLGAHAGFGRPTRNQVQPEWPNQLQRAFLPSIAMMAARYRSMDVFEYLQSDVARVDWKHGLLDSMPTQKHFFLHSLSAKAEFRDLKSWHCLGKGGDLHVSHWYSFSPVMTLMKAPAKMKRREATSIFERNKQLVEQCETLLLKAPGLPDVKVGAVITGLTMLGYDHDEVEENKTREADETGPGSRSFTMENQKEWSDTRHAGLGFFVTSNNSADRVAFYCAAHLFNDLFEGKKFPAEIPDATMAETMRNHRRSKRKREDEILESKDEKEKKDQHMEGGHGDEDDENNCGPVNCSEMHEAGEGAALCGAGGEGRGYEEEAPVVPPTRKRRCVAQGKKAAAAPPTSLSASQKQKKAKAMKGPPSVVTKTCKKASKKAAAKNRYSTDAKQNVEADEEDPPPVLDDDEAEAGGGGGGTQHKNSASGGSSSSSASALVDLERGACWRQLLTVLSGVLEPETYVLHASFQDTNASAARLEFHLVFPAGNRDSTTTTSSGGNASSPAAPKGQHGSDVEVELMRFGLIGAGKGESAFPFRGFSAFRPPLDKRDTTPLTPFEFAWVKFLFRELVAAQARPTTIMLGQTLANFRANSLHAAWTAPYFELLVPKRYQMPRLHRLGLLVFNLLLREAFMLSGASDNPLFRPPDGFGVDVDHAIKMARGGGGGETDEEVEESQSLYEIGGGPLLFDGHHDARAGAPGRAGGARRGGGGAGGGRGERSSRRLFEMVDALDDMELDKSEGEFRDKVY